MILRALPASSPPLRPPAAGLPWFFSKRISLLQCIKAVHANQSPNGQKCMHAWPQYLTCNSLLPMPTAAEPTCDRTDDMQPAHGWRNDLLSILRTTEGCVYFCVFVCVCMCPSVRPSVLLSYRAPASCRNRENHYVMVITNNKRAALHTATLHPRSYLCVCMYVCPRLLGRQELKS